MLIRRTSYDENAAYWTRIIRDGLDRYRTDLTNPAVSDMIGNCAGLSVLDAGCGEGYLSRSLAANGALVTGVDTSATLVDEARAAAEAQGVNASYRVADVTRLPFPDSTYDLVVCNHLFNDLSSPDAAAREISRVLRESGRLVVLMLHPCFYGTRHGASRAEIHPTSYFSERTADEAFNVAGLRSPAKVTVHMRSLEDYVGSLTQAGFQIAGLREPHPSRELLKDDWWRTNFPKPLFLLLTAVKVTQMATAQRATTRAEMVSSRSPELPG